MNKTEIKAGGSVEARSAGAEPPTHEGRSPKCVGEAELHSLFGYCARSGTERYMYPLTGETNSVAG